MEQMQRGYADTMIHQNTPDKRWVEFEQRPILNKMKSREQGAPFFETRVFVTIQHPGDNLNKIVRPATEGDKMEFVAAWRAFETKTAPIPDGTLTSVLFPHNPDIVETLKYHKIFVVEQLASLNDTQIQGIGMGGRQLHDKAKSYLEAAEKGRGFHKLEQQLDQLMSEREADKQRIAALEAALGDETRRGPGRPRKDAA